MKKYLKDLLCCRSRKIIWLIIAAGIFMRVEFYRTSLVDIDEYFTSYNIEKFKITEVFEPSGRNQVYNQAQPIGFLIIENVIIKLFGSGKYMLRLFPLVCGIISLLLFYKVAKLYCEPVAVPIALMFFAVSQQLIRYSSIIKHYSCDVLIGLILLFGIKDLQEKPLNHLRILLWGGVGSVAMWISHAAILILPGLGLVLILDTARKKEKTKLKKLLIIGSIFAINLAFLYHAQLNNLTDHKGALYFWQDWFPSFEIKSLADLELCANTLWAGFKMVRLVPYNIALFMCGVGCVYMFAKKKRDFFYLMAPILFVVTASGLEKYPFYERLILFLVPILILFIAEGIGYVIKNRIAHFPGIILLAVLISMTSLEAKNFLINPPGQLDPIEIYMSDNWRAGDILYTYYPPNPKSREYFKSVERTGLVMFVYAPDSIGYFSGEEKYNVVNNQAWNNPARNSQIWVGFFNVDKNKEKEILAGFDKGAVKVDRITASGRVFYLYKRKQHGQEARIPVTLPRNSLPG